MWEKSCFQFLRILIIDATEAGISRRLKKCCSGIWPSLMAATAAGPGTRQSLSMNHRDPEHCFPRLAAILSPDLTYQTDDYFSVEFPGNEYVISTLAI